MGQHTRGTTSKSNARTKYFALERIGVIVHFDNDSIDTIKLAMKRAMRFTAKKSTIPSRRRRDVCNISEHVINLFETCKCD